MWILVIGMSAEGEKLEIEVHWKEGMKMLSNIRGFDPILIDDRKKGTDSAPSPVEVFLSAIGSCLAMAFVYCNHIAGTALNPDDLIVKMSGEVGRVDDRLRVTKVHAEFLVKSDQKPSKIQTCFKKFQPFCILSESIQAGIPFSCNLKLIK
jgi:uncharacterized OsmC-like protein